MNRAPVIKREFQNHDQKQNTKLKTKCDQMNSSTFCTKSALSLGTYKRIQNRF